MLNEIIKAQTIDRDATNDEYLTNILVNKTMEDVVRSFSTSLNVKAYTCYKLVMDAIIERDIGLINQIIKRVDGTIPTVTERKNFANIFGNSLEEVMQQQADNRFNIDPKDKAITAMSKAIIYVALTSGGNNVSKKKDRVMAVDILLSRTGGMRSEPVRQQLETTYVRPDWSLEKPKGKNE